MTQNARHRRPKPQAKPTKGPQQSKESNQSQLSPMQQWLIDHNLKDDDGQIMRIDLPLSVEELFAKISNSPAEVTGADLFSLSDLTRADADYIRKNWLLLPVAQRCKVVEQLVETTEDQLDLAPGEFFRIILRDDDPQVRQQAIEGLWEDEDEDLIGPYIQIMQHDSDAKVQAAAAVALGSYVLLGELEELAPALAMRVEQSLFEILEDKSQPLLVQCRALESVAFSGDEGLRQLIEEAYYSPFEEMRLSSLRAMGRSSDIRWRTMAQTELQSPEAAMRAEAAIACGELEHKAATKEILGLLNDEEQIVRFSAIYALGHIGGKTARAALRKIAANGQSEEAEAAEEALEEMLFFSDISAMIEQLQGVGVDSEMEMDDAEDLDEEDDSLDLDDELGLNSESLWDSWSTDDDGGSDDDPDHDDDNFDENAFDDKDIDGDDFDSDEFDEKWDDFDEEDK